MGKTLYFNPITETEIEFKQTLSFSIENVSYKDKNEKPGFVTYLKTDKTVVYVPNRKVFGDNKAYIFNKDTIKSLEIFTEEERKDKSVIGRAIVGGLLTGGIGAVVGGMSGLKTDYKGYRKVIINDNFFFKFDEKNYNKISDFFFEIDRELKKYHSQQLENKEEKKVDNPIEKLKELKSLLDLGIISQEEFEIKKEELMKQI